MVRIFLSAYMLLASFAAAAVPVQEYLLDNGLKLIVREDHRAPVVVSQIWYKLGATYEQSPSTGVSHVLEHMMFKGTERYPAGEFSRIVAANGGSENAFTGRDYTAYYQQLASDRLEVSFHLEADRMRGLRFTEEDFRKELEVVKEERRLRTEDQPRALTVEHFNAAAYLVSPNRNPVIGWMEDLDRMTLEDVKAWYRRWYAPDNAVLVVVGDVDPMEVFKLAQKHFGPLSGEGAATPRPIGEPEQRGPRRVTVRAPAKQPYLVMGYKTPVVGQAAAEWEPYALEMLAHILDGGDSARLSRELIRGERIAATAGAEYSAYSRLPGMLLLDGTPSLDQDLETLEDALREQVARLREQLVSERELARVRAQMVASEVFEQDSIFYQAMRIGLLETIGLNWRLDDEYVARLSAVTSEQVRAVARKYLVDERFTVAVLEPQPIGDLQPERRAAMGERYVR